MTEFPPGRGRPECETDVAAYVLGALEPRAAQALREHLATCAVCRDELAELQRVADVLPLAVPQLAVPRGLKRRVFAQVREQPAVARAGMRERLSPRPVALAGAIAVIAAAAVLLVASAGSNGTRTIRASVTAPGASAVLRLSSGHAALTVDHLPKPPAGKIYEVWLKRGDAAPTPTAALFDVTAAGAAAVRVPGDLHGVNAVLVTPEGRGGSLVPTHAPVIVVRL